MSSCCFNLRHSEHLHLVDKYKEAQEIELESYNSDYTRLAGEVLWTILKTGDQKPDTTQTEESTESITE